MDFFIRGSGRNPRNFGAGFRGARLVKKFFNFSASIFPNIMFDASAVMELMNNCPR